MEWLPYALGLLAIVLIIITIKLPFWKTDLQKILILFLSVGVFFGLPMSISSIRIEIQPVQTEYVEVMSKQTKEITDSDRLKKLNDYVVFKFSDGSEKEFYINSRELFHDLQEGDIGVLSYKETKNNTMKLGNKRFITFEKNMTLDTIRSSKDSNPVITLVIFILAWSLFIGGFGGWLIWSLRRYKKILSKKEQGKEIKQMDKSKVGLIALFCTFGPISLGLIGGIIFFALSDVKNSTMGIVFFSVMLAFIFVFSFFIIRLALKNLEQPEQKVQVTVLEKGKREYWQLSPGTDTGGHTVIKHFATFEFTDGTRLRLDLFATAYEMLRENTTGALYYKKRNGEKWFIRFDPTDTQPLSLNRS